MGSNFILRMKLGLGFLAAAYAAPTPVIIGGSNASNGEFPHQVTLYTGTSSHFCGGSIIKENKIMCAAHCKQSRDFKAGAGSVTRTSQPQNLNIASRNQLAHPSYNSRTIDYDYMIITTTGSFSFGSSVNSIPLVAASNSELPNNTACKTSGYGYSRHINGTPSQIASTLQWTNINCITTTECKKTWRTQTIGSRQQCGDVSGATSCMGDSGGPLTVREGLQDKLLGNVSWGHSGCSTTGYPGVYSRNADPTINAWIKSNAGI